MTHDCFQKKRKISEHLLSFFNINSTQNHVCLQKVRRRRCLNINQTVLWIIQLYNMILKTGKWRTSVKGKFNSFFILIFVVRNKKNIRCMRMRYRRAGIHHLTFFSRLMQLMHLFLLKVV